ncbi:protein phosphatase 2C domain-containing protein [Streptomyces sp. NBC_01214]|uniref:protein phosphatase 2C domain-containing protein n=1 Tax=Streptomyces sp. NBC_01214 TaxID=2903777 RepID=UPI00224D281C|nr:protein phosphatase 2C domain-containing protein [Streptomyces sp. NBC_01214]MCX4800599.1 protein phosphatase 2C domain-containing protein [Streptomyces sp. NBC_01214]
MYVSVATEPGGSAPNEDWVGGTSSLALVLDGLSTAGLETGCRHGVPWYVAQLGAHLIAALATYDRPLADGLAEALERVGQLHPECDLRNPGTPSSTVAILRERPGHFDHLVLADSPVVLEGTGGITVLTDLRVDDVCQDLRAETERYQTGTLEHRASVARLVAAQREIRNTDEGYWVAAATPDAAAHALTGTAPAASIQSAAVMSDGISRLVTEYEMATWDAVLAQLRDHGPASLIRTVREVEATDPHGQRWPRYKAGDDAAVAYCSLPSAPS